MNDFLCPQLENLCPCRKNVLTESPPSSQNKLRRNIVFMIPLALIVASISASFYMGFLWRPAEPKRVRLFFYDVHGNLVT
jgi:hypothetical protein